MTTHTPGQVRTEIDRLRASLNDAENQIDRLVNERADLRHDNAKLRALNAELVAALDSTIIPLMRLGDFIGNTDVGGASGLGSFDRCAVIQSARAALAKARQS